MYKYIEEEKGRFENMTRYQNGRIYKILNTIDEDVYVGSTTEALCKRMWKHKSDFKNNRFITRPLYVKAKDYGFENFPYRTY